MAEATDAQGILHENLLDAGCDSELTERVMELLNTGHIREGLLLLSRHRKTVLESCHAEQRKMECLDYLIYQLKKQKTEM
ncbi:MAG: hypothetical protein NC420_12145 [Eubacterium sp.]|nr:hypothetical protein [Eubacterium sp.]MCM1215807.1 hypothetical protein [Lachnospiraceae bacterium]MCM1304108.1 hypothetical protein [Butyrivibrio sp.]MCM1344066.1 hypothetical protein [Muribaculaceae bacterium]MCM1238369.1 hypothetical protein [Lachnospiraceae bacterium]